MRPHDPIQLGKLIFHIATGQVEDEEPPAGKSKTAVAPLVVAPESVGVPGSTTTTTTIAPTTGHTTTFTKGVDANGNEITKKDTYREGITGSSETHKNVYRAFRL
jgi:hypothetical protein